MDTLVRTFTSEVKSVGDYTIKGRAIVFGGKDLVGDRFTKETDLGASRSFLGLPV